MSVRVSAGRLGPDHPDSDDRPKSRAVGGQLSEAANPSMATASEK